MIIGSLMQGGKEGGGRHIWWKRGGRVHDEFASSIGAKIPPMQLVHW
jgi:hypothetical protein